MKTVGKITDLRETNTVAYGYSLFKIEMNLCMNLNKKFLKGKVTNCFFLYGLIDSLKPRTDLKLIKVS